MDSFNFHGVRLQKPNSNINHPRIPRLITLFRAVELLVVLIFVSRFTTMFSFSFNLSAEHFRELSGTLTSPRYVFIIGNAIVITLFLISRSLSTKVEDKNEQIYENHTEICQKNKSLCVDKEKKVAEKIKTSRSYSENMDKRGREHHPVLRRSMTDRGIKAELSSGTCSDDMSGEEFRQTVEAFIARQQRILRRK